MTLELRLGIEEESDKGSPGTGHKDRRAQGGSSLWRWAWRVDVREGGWEAAGAALDQALLLI